MHRSLFVLGLVLFWSFPVVAQLPRLELPEDAVGLEGHTKSIVVDLDTRELLIDGYSFDVCHDSAIISLDEENILPGSAIEELDFDTHIITTEDGGWGVAAILAEGNSVGEDESIDLELYVVTYDLDAIGETDLTFCGDIETANAVVDGEDTEWVLDEGHLEVREEGPSFRRGDVDGDGVVHPLADGVVLLASAFNEFDVPCMEAADVDGSGSVVAIVDGMRLLNWGAGHANAPPDPGPETSASSTASAALPAPMFTSVRERVTDRPTRSRPKCTSLVPSGDSPERIALRASSASSTNAISGLPSRRLDKRISSGASSSMSVRTRSRRLAQEMF